MHILDETSCAKGKPIRSLWTADEARMVKHILNNLTVKQWNLPSTEVERDMSGDWTIWIPSGSSSVMSYSSYFRVINASTTDPDTTIIGVTNGSAAMLDPVGNCGTVKINGERVDVDAATETVSSDGVYYVWIHSWIDAVDGEQAEIIFGTADDDEPPDNPHGGVAFASQLAGRVTVTDGAITGITQDYLRGGEHMELLYGDCDGGTLLT
jgi:hypothetical protein